MPNLENLFDEARRFCGPAAARDQWLATACAGDAALCRAVLAMLACAAQEERDQTAALERLRAAVTSGVGRRIGPYAISRLLGSGGMGSVFLAQRVDGSFEQQVAVKLLPFAAPGDPFLLSFHEERRILARLDHPNITRLLDGGTLPSGEPYLVMEYVEGQPFDEYQDQRRLPVSARLRLFREVCGAVAFLHQHLVLHRDLKPSNILVNRDGVPKVLDFGAAKLQDAAASTGLSISLLTPRYASPEQLAGLTVTTRSDVFSLGVLLYESLTGAWPFGDRRDPMQGWQRLPLRAPARVVTEAAAEMRGTSLQKLHRALRGDLGQILARALAEDSAERYASVAELAADIDRYLRHQPVAARPQTIGYRLTKFARRHRGRLLLAALAGMMVVTLALFNWRQFNQGQRRAGQLRELSQSYLTDVYREVSRLPGSSKARLMMIEKSRRHLDTMLAENPRDPLVRDALAAAYIQLAEVLGEPFALSMGDPAGATASYRKAEELAAVASPADRPETTGLLVRAQMGLAALQIRAGEFEPAATTLRAALEPARRLWLDAPPEMTLAGRRIGLVYANLHKQLGHAMMLSANRDASIPGMQSTLQQFEKALAAAREARQKDPMLPDLPGRLHQYLGYTHELLGAHRGGDPREFQLAVAAHAINAESGRRNLAALGTTLAKRDCADGLTFLGASRILAGDDRAARTDLGDAKRLLDEVAQAEPESREVDLDLALVHYFLGEAEVGLGRYGPALANLERASRLSGLPQTPAAVDREKAELYLRIREQVARIHRQQRQYGAAAQALRQALTAAAISHLPGWKVERIRRKLSEMERSQRDAAGTPLTREDEWRHY